MILDPNGLLCYAEKLKGKITSVFLEAPKEVRRLRMIRRGDDAELIKIRLEKDDAIFRSEQLPLDFIVRNEGVDLLTLAEKVYNLYREHQEKI